MVNITKENYETNGIEVIPDTFDELWLDESLKMKNYLHLQINMIKNIKNVDMN